MSRFSVSRLRTRLALMALVAIAPALGITAYTQLSERRAVRERAIADGVQLARMASRRSANVFEGINHVLKTLALLPAVRSNDPHACNELLRDVLRDHPGYAVFGVANGDGSTFCLSAPIDPQYPSTSRSWFQRVLQTRSPSLGDYQTSRITGKADIVLAHPLLLADGKVDRVIFAGVELDEIERLLSDGVALPAGATLTLVDRGQRVLARQPAAGSAIGQTVTDADLVPELEASLAADGVRVGGRVGGPHVHATLLVSSDGIDLGTSVNVTMERAVIFAEVDRLWRQQCWLLGIVSLIALAAAWFGSVVFVLRPLENLKQVAGKIAQGDFGARVLLTGIVPGLNDLGADINAMALALEVRQHERDRAAEDLRVSEQRYRILFEDNPRPMWVYDPATLEFLAVNQAAVDQYGYSRDEFLGLGVGEIHSEEEDRQESLDLLRLSDEARHGGVSRHRAKDDRTFTVEVSTSLVRWAGRTARLAIVEDITERKQLADQLRQAQKMDAVGQLAGGVAHDFNNLLTAITGYSELVIARLEDGNPIKDDVEEIRRAGNRAAALTQQLLAFSRKQMLRPRVVDLNVVVQGMEPMLRRVIREDIALTMATEVGLLPTKGDPGQIEQILLNLTINARDAMPQGGEIRVETANVVMDAAFVRSHPGAVAGRYVSLAVRDTGVGMSAEVQAHVFEPFYTTKALGKGTGLGLSMVYGAVKQSGGYIALDSEVGQGTTFQVYLPVSQEVVANVERVPEPAIVSNASETVLIADDEVGVRQLVRKILGLRGYTVLEAQDPNDALRIASEYEGTIDLLITDVVMPEMNGPALAQRLALSRPAMRVLFMSGYVVRDGGDRELLRDGVAFLQKPFSPDALARKAREVLDPRPLSAGAH